MTRMQFVPRAHPQTSLEFQHTLNQLKHFTHRKAWWIQLERQEDETYLPAACEKPSFWRRLWYLLFGKPRTLQFKYVAQFLGSYLRDHEDQLRAQSARSTLRALSMRFGRSADFTRKTALLATRIDEAIAHEKVFAATEQERRAIIQDADTYRAEAEEALASRKAEAVNELARIQTETDRLQAKRKNLEDFFIRSRMEIREEMKAEGEAILARANESRERIEAKTREVIEETKLKNRQLIEQAKELRRREIEVAILNFPKHQLGHSAILERKDRHDLRLICKEDTVLTTCSLFFLDCPLLSPEVLEQYKEKRSNGSDQYVVPMQDFSADAVNMLIRYSAGVDSYESIPLPLLPELMLLANYVGAKGLEQQTTERLLKLSENAELAIDWLESYTFPPGPVSDKILQTVVDNMDLVLKRVQAPAIPIATLIQLLQQPRLAVLDEAKLLTFLIEYQRIYEIEIAPVLPYVRVEDLELEAFASIADALPLEFAQPWLEYLATKETHPRPLPIDREQYQAPHRLRLSLHIEAMPGHRSWVTFQLGDMHRLLGSRRKVKLSFPIKQFAGSDISGNFSLSRRPNGDVTLALHLADADISSPNPIQAHFEFPNVNPEFIDDSGEILLANLEELTLKTEEEKRDGLQVTAPLEAWQQVVANNRLVGSLNLGHLSATRTEVPLWPL